LFHSFFFSLFITFIKFSELMQSATVLIFIQELTRSSLDRNTCNPDWRSSRFSILPLQAYSGTILQIRETTLPFRGLSPQANYTDRATAACRRSQYQPLRVEGVTLSAQRIPTAVNLGFIERSRYFFIQVAPQLSSRGWVDPVLDPLILRKSCRAGNRTQDLWICRQKLWPLERRGGPLPFTFFPNHCSYFTFNTI
jgi:hypothetical protein